VSNVVVLEDIRYEYITIIYLPIHMCIYSCLMDAVS
jgi:hypothetical protein